MISLRALVRVMVYLSSRCRSRDPCLAVQPHHLGQTSFGRPSVCYKGLDRDSDVDMHLHAPRPLLPKLLFPSVAMNIAFSFDVLPLFHQINLNPLCVFPDMLKNVQVK